VTVSDALRGVVKIGVDSAPIVDFIEQTPGVFDVGPEIFAAIDRGPLTGATSTVSLTETLVFPMQAGNLKLTDAYREFVQGDGVTFTLLPVTAEIAESAADFRARYNLRTPDAIQIATALSAGCDAFLTGDRQLRRVTELNVLMLYDLTL